MKADLIRLGDELLPRLMLVLLRASQSVIEPGYPGSKINLQSITFYHNIFISLIKLVVLTTIECEIYKSRVLIKFRYVELF